MIYALAPAVPLLLRQLQSAGNQVISWRYLEALQLPKAKHVHSTSIGPEHKRNRTSGSTDESSHSYLQSVS